MIPHSQFFQLVQSRERSIHVFDSPGDFIILEIPFRRSKHKKHFKKKEEKKIHTQKTTALVMLIKLYAALHFA